MRTVHCRVCAQTSDQVESIGLTPVFAFLVEAS
jgi:hypothetical protein